MKRRVVITGLGIVSPVGNDIPTAWDNIVNGRSGIGRGRWVDRCPFARPGMRAPMTGRFSDSGKTGDYP